MAETIVIWVFGILFFSIVILWFYGERGAPLRNSTWNTIKAYGWKNNLNLTGFHGYIYGRWIKEYIHLD